MAESSGNQVAELQSVVHMIREYARQSPEKPALIVLADGEAESERLSYRELDSRARSLAAFLQAQDMKGERAVLLLPQGTEYVVAFLGCLYAQAIAVPAATFSRGKQAERIARIAGDCGPRMILTTRVKTGTVRSLVPSPGTVVAVEDIPEGGGDWTEPDITANDLAYLQYTSGSTSSPRGVRVSHRNVMHQCGILEDALRLGREGTAVSWLPLFHDMGLVSGLLHPLSRGATTVLMPPTAFVQEPTRWLTAISRYRGTASFTPAFGLALCSEHVGERDRQDIDLSCLRTILVGAEPVPAQTLETFAAAFRGCGFSPDAYMPGYGLAEATLAVAIRDHSQPLTIASCDAEELSRGRLVPAAPGSRVRRVVGHGHAWRDTELVVADPQTRVVCPDGAEGEVWVHGQTVAGGYWGQPNDHEDTFGAYLADGRGPFLRTGDLAIRHDGQLYLTGRRKDLIIIHGRNHHPQDIELTVGSAHPALADRGAAFSVATDGGERLVVAHELKRSHRGKADLPAVVRSIETAIAAEHEIMPESIVLLRPVGLPITSSGKVRRQECKRLYLSGELAADYTWRARPDEAEEPAPAAADGPPAAADGDRDRDTGQYAAIVGWLAARIGALREQPAEEVDVDMPFAAFGIDSVTLVRLSGELQRWLGRPVNPLDLYSYPTIARLARFVAHGEAGNQANSAGSGPTCDEPVAVVGMACDFPGAPSVSAFWDLLVGGKEAISSAPLSRGWYEQDQAADDGTPYSGGIRLGGFIDGIAEFDPVFFGVSAAEARAMDPQQRLLLTTAWRALEDAAIAPSAIAGGSAGVFIGISGNDYRQLQARDRVEPSRFSGTGNALSIAANRISYAFDLRGPSQAVDTACSSSLVALHHAVVSLRRHECDIAIVGGVNLLLDPDVSAALSRAGMLAADGRCKTFDAAADGYVRAEGCGVVILERSGDAARRGNHPLAFVRGSAVSQDGQSNSLTAPSGLAQQAVIRQALAAAEMTPDEVGYVEAHGTGTSLGDPIEFAALAEVYRKSGVSPPAWIASVKTNIGHLEAAAGIAGFIKLVLALQHRQIPAHLNLRQVNPYIGLDGTRFQIPAATRDWPAGPAGRAGAVSSFGFGGTNAHVVVADNTEPRRAPGNNEPFGPQLLPVSAKTPSALVQLAQRQAGMLSDPAVRVPLHAACHTAGVHRDHYRHRLAVVADSCEDAARLLRQHPAPRTPGLAAGIADLDRGPVAFLFTGQGAQFPGMASALYARYALFRDVVDRCDEIVSEYLGSSLRPAICGTPGDPVDLSQTGYAQPALFITDYAIAALWQACGLRPDYVLGHSLGEYVAACVAGVLTIEDALLLVIRRGQLMQDLVPPGVMYAVHAAPAVLDGLRAIINAEDGPMAIAAENGPEDLVISGSPEPARRLAARCEEAGARVFRLPGTRGFHSPLVAAAAAEFGAFAGPVAHRSARIPVISNVTGAVTELGPGYWTEQMLSPVQFGLSLGTLADRGCRTLVEAGPHPALLPVAASVLPHATQLPSARRGDTDDRRFLHSMARWYVGGGQVNWAGLTSARQGTAGPPAVTPLPPYPLERTSYWYMPRQPRRHGPHPLLGEAVDLAATPGRWFRQTLAVARPWFLGQHRLHGTAVVPAAAIAEWALAAARSAEVSPAGPWTLEGVTFREQLRLSDHQPTEVQAVLETAGGTSAVRCFSRLPGGERTEWTEWTEHAAVAAISAGGPAPGRFPPPEGPGGIAARMTELDIQALYPRLRHAGLHYGPAFQGLRRLWLGAGEALGFVDRVQSAGEEGPYLLHPVTLDACFHVAAAFLGASGAIWLPVGIERLSVYGPIPARVWCVARDRGRQGPGRQLIDFDVISGSGEHLVAVEGLQLAELPVSGGQDEPLRQYQLAWREWAGDVADAAVPSGTWLIAGGDGAVVRDWRRQLAEAGQTALGIVTQPAGQPGAPDVFTVDPEAEQDIGHLLAALHRRLGRVAGLILHAGPFLAGQDDRDVPADAYRVARHLLLVKQFMARFGAAQPAIVFCSAGAADVAGSGAPDLAQSLTAASARAVTAEYPGLKCVHIDLEPGATAPGPLDLLRRAASLPGSGHLALRGGRWYVARLQASDLPTGPQRPPVRPDATYLITGGLGGLGLAVAAWLADQGARSLLLVGRHADGPEPAEVAALRERGIRVTLGRADIADPADVQALIRLARDELPVIRGIVHAAGVLADASLENLSWERCRQVLDPKVKGAWQLHREAGDDLDFFVLFSSMASLTGSAGQSNYVLGNAFLDALARYRQHRGQAGLSIGWGPWSETGMAARDDLLARLDAAGNAGIATDEALEALGLLLGSPAPHVGVARMGWQRFPAAAGRGGPDTLIDDLSPAASGNGHRADGAPPALLVELAVTEPETAREMLLTEMFERSMALLGREAAHREELRATFRHMRLSELGFDSLLAVQLRNQIQADFAADVPPQRLLGQSTVLDAAELILHQLAIRNVIAMSDGSDPGDADVEVLTL